MKTWKCTPTGDVGGFLTGSQLFTGQKTIDMIALSAGGKNSEVIIYDGTRDDYVNGYRCTLRATANTTHDINQHMPFGTGLYALLSGSGIVLDFYGMD